MKQTLLSGSAVVHAIFIVLACWVIWVAHDLPGGGNMMPTFAALGIIAFSVAYIVKDVIAGLRAGQPRSVVPALSTGFVRVVAVFVACAVYVVAILYLGFFVSTLLFVCISAAFLGVSSWRAIVLTAMVLLPLLYGFFILFLGANLPRGILI